MSLGRTLIQTSASAIALAFALSAGGAWAQTSTQRPVAPPQTEQDDEATDVDEIVVTGTLLRGIAPVGTNVVGVAREDVVATGAASANDLLASIPQIGNFNTVPAGGAGVGNPIVRPNIRNLGASGSNTTLVLLNGHRIVGAGILQTTPDPTVIPPGVIDRVEVIPDGGSSIYGSDAIGGVVNFITRRNFDGVEVTARFGVADDYDTRDFSVTGGRSWSSGSVFASYAHAEHTNLSRADRDYASSYRSDLGFADFRSTACSPGTITANGTTYALPNRVPATSNRCDIAEAADLYPEESRDSLFVGLAQTLSDSLEFRIDGYYSQRDTKLRGAQVTTSGVIRPTNPYFRPIAAETAQTVAFGYNNVFGDATGSTQSFESYGVTPSLIWDINENWQLRTHINLGRSDNTTHEDSLNPVAIAAGLAGTTLSTALNPYDPGQSAAGVLAGIEDYEFYSHAIQELAEFRAIVDGSIFTLAGGDVRLAAGIEQHHDRLKPDVATGQRGTSQGALSADVSRDITSVFAEVFVPIVGEANGMLGLRGLDLTGSVRYDDYSDVGGTTNPKVGFNYKPVMDLTIRGNYGTSFNAPSLADNASNIDTRGQVLANSNTRAPGSPASDQLRTTIQYAGGNANLEPEEATTYSLGFDWKPDAIPNLSVSATYFNVEYTNVIGLIPLGNASALFGDPAYAPFVIINPTLAQLQAIFGNARLEGAASLSDLYANGQSPYLYRDARRNNLGEIYTDGIDFNVAYRQPMDWGSLSASVAGTYTLSRDTKANANATKVDALLNGTRELALVGTVGAQVGGFSARASVNYGGGYPILANALQTEVDSFTTVDLFFSQDLGDRWGLQGTTLTLNVDNVADEDPPYTNAAAGFTNGSTLGRTFIVGVRKRF